MASCPPLWLFGEFHTVVHTGRDPSTVMTHRRPPSFRHETHQRMEHSTRFREWVRETEETESSRCTVQTTSLNLPPPPTSPRNCPSAIKSPECNPYNRLICKTGNNRRHRRLIKTTALRHRLPVLAYLRQPPVARVAGSSSNCIYISNEILRPLFITCVLSSMHHQLASTSRDETSASHPLAPQPHRYLFPIGI